MALISVDGDTAENMVELLEDLYVDDANRRRPNSVRVVADSRSNGILVSGSSGDVRAIRDLIQRIDTQDPARLVEVRTVALASANAIETVSLIESVLRGGGTGEGRPPCCVTSVRMVIRSRFLWHCEMSSPPPLMFERIL